MDELAAKQILLDFELITLIALAVGVIGYGLVRRLRHREVAAGLPDYDGFDFVLMFFPAILFLINPIIEAVMAGSEVAESAREPANGIGTMLLNIGYFVFVGVMTYGLIEWIRNRRLSDLFGLRRQRLSKIILFSIIGGIASLLICAWAVGEFSSLYLENILGDLDLQEPVKMLQESDSKTHFTLSVLMACIAAPLVEEFLFRGYMYGVIRQLTNPVFAAVVIGALFAVVHGNLPALLPLWTFSILLSFAYERTGSLWVPIGIHIFFNAANIALMLIPEALE